MKCLTIASIGFAVFICICAGLHSIWRVQPYVPPIQKEELLAMEKRALAAADKAVSDRSQKRMKLSVCGDETFFDAFLRASGQKKDFADALKLLASDEPFNVAETVEKIKAASLESWAVKQSLERRIDVAKTLAGGDSFPQYPIIPQRLKLWTEYKLPAYDGETCPDKKFKPYRFYNIYYFKGIEK